MVAPKPQRIETKNIIRREIGTEGKLVNGFAKPSRQDRISAELALVEQFPGTVVELLQNKAGGNAFGVLVNLGIHEIAHHQIVLDRAQAFARWDNQGQPLAIALHYRNNAIEIEMAILGTRKVAIPQQVIEAITIQLARNELCNQRYRKTVLKHRHKVSGEFWVMGPQE